MKGKQLTYFCLAIGLVFGSVSAHALTVAYSGSGQVTGPAQTPPFFTQLQVLPANSQYTFAGESGWTQDSLFSFNAATLTGAGAGTFSKGEDSLAFTFTSTTASLGAPLFLSLTIVSGTGIYSGYVGTGTSEVQLLGNPLGLPVPIPFTDSNGQLTLSPVPELPTAALFLLGAAGIRRSIAARSHNDGDT